MRRSVYFSLILIVGAFSCARKEAKFAGERGGLLVIGTMDLPARISPLEPSLFSSNDVLDLLFLRLHRVDPRTGKMQPVLAESWEFSEDLKSITYYLRRDVKWWDGEAVTADDILYTYLKMKEPATNYPYVNALRFIKDATVLNAHAIRFTCDKVYADILTDTDIMPVPKHIYEQKGADFGREPVGNGPYRIKEWIVGRGMVLTINERYYREQPALDEIYLKHYTDAAEMVDDFARGDLDLVLDIAPGAAQDLRRNENVSVLSQPGNTYLYVAWNLTRSFLKDIRVREALSMAINRKRILDEIYLGMGEMSSGPLTPSSWGYDAEVTPVEYDTNGARALLREQGFVDFNRNRIIDKDRQDFVVTIITNSENPDRVAIMRYVAEDLRKIGIRVVAQALDASEFIKALVNRQFDGFIMGWNVVDKIDPAACWSSQGKFNFVAYENAAVDSLIEAGVSMLDRKRAKQIWNEFQNTVYDDQPYSFLIVPNRIAATYKRVKGVEHEVKLVNAQMYWIPEAERRVSIAASKPEISRGEERIETVALVPARTETVQATSQEIPSVVAPERLLEATAQGDTSVTDTAGAIVAVLPPAPPKPSVISRAEPTKRFEPKYPAAAAEFNASGTVVVRVLVGEDGKVKEAKIINSFGNPACEQAALDAARKWEFTPATKDGVPFEQRVSIPFTFTP
jgi:peptide/nickel transport system substrate-binding protein